MLADVEISGDSIRDIDNSSNKWKETRDKRERGTVQGMKKVLGFCRVSPSILTKLMRHHWVQNVRIGSSCTKVCRLWLTS